MGLKPTPVGWISLAGGLTGGSLALLMQWWMNGHDYPLYRHIRDSGIFEQVAAEWSPALQLPVSSGGAPTQRPVAFVTAP